MSIFSPLSFLRRPGVAAQERIIVFDCEVPVMNVKRLFLCIGMVGGIVIAARDQHILGFVCGFMAAFILFHLLTDYAGSEREEKGSERQTEEVSLSDNLSK